ncbi:MAG: hypothetical protein K2X91_04125 [Thermoleophilia bacterium]|nr:hypothetical protein [Thermoleophilia bacterium]
MNFYPRFAAKILEGSKPFTMRKIRKDGRDPALGATLYLFTGMRTPAVRQFATTTVVGRATVTMGPAGIVDVAHPVLAGHAANPDWRRAENVMGDFVTAARFPAGPLTPERLARIAVGDGFADWPAMWAFHEANALDLDGHAVRELYIFGPVHADDGSSRHPAPPPPGPATGDLLEEPAR